ncbi:MAG: alpha/beta hydrolase [Chthoniobacteraceae bacterium]
MNRLTLLLAAWLCFFRTLSAADPTDIRIERGVAYLPEFRDEKADLYLPLEIAKGTRVPAVVIIHGGGFTGGKRDAARELNIGGTLARNGYIGMSIDYALSAPNKPTWPQNLHDCKTAVRWLRANADRLQIDAAHIGVIGGSAGGTLSSLVTLTRASDELDPAEPYGEFSCAVQCGVDLYGIADMSQWHDNVMFGKTNAEAPHLYRQASPVTYARADGPPILILHGTADTTVDVSQSEGFAEALKKAGAPHELVIIPGAPHTFDLQPKQRDLRPVVLGFFDRNLKPSR